MDSKKGESIVGVCLTECAHPDFLVRLDANHSIDPYVNKSVAKRRQDIEDLYFYEGSFYISTIQSIIQNEGFYHKKTLGFKIPKWKSLEIDDIYDFIMCESLMKAKLDNKF